MSSLTRWVLAHKRIVVLSWIVLTIAGMAAAGPASDALDQKFSVPNKEGWETNVEIAQQYGGTGGDSSPLLPVVTLPPGKTVDSPGVRKDLGEMDARLARALPGARIASYAVHRRPRPSSPRDGRTAFALAYPRPDQNSQFGENPAAEKNARAALEGPDGGRRTGAPDRVRRPEPGGRRRRAVPGVLLEALLGGLGALIVLAFVFASFLAVVPLADGDRLDPDHVPAAARASPSCTDVSPIVQFLIALIGLGVAIDYSLLVVSRWREERAHGDRATRRCSGRWRRPAVRSYSAASPSAIGLLALVALPLPFLRSMGYGGLLIPLVSTLVAITLLPVVLAKLRPAAGLAAPPHRRPGEPGLDALGAGGRTPAVGRRWAGLAVLLRWRSRRPTCLGASDANTGAVGRRQGRTGGARGAGIGEGALLPHEILVEGATGSAAVARSLREVDGIHGAVAPATPTGAAVAQRSSRRSLPCDSGPRTRRTRRAGRRAGGQPASNAVYGMPSALIADHALIAITRSSCWRRRSAPAACRCKASSVLVWQRVRLGGDLGHPGATGSIPSWMPLMIFAFLFGLSMDYEVFILSRMREEYDRTGSTEAAVVQGIGRTGRLVTSAALILFLAFDVDGVGAGDRPEDVRHRPGRGDPARRDRDPGADRPGAGHADGPLELVAAGVAGAATAGRARRSPARRPRERRSDGQAKKACRFRPRSFDVGVEPHSNHEEAAACDSWFWSPPTPSTRRAGCPAPRSSRR